MINNINRIGKYTSSEIVALLSCGVRDMTADELAARPKKGKGSKTTTIEDKNSFGDAAMTYISETNMERRLLRSLNSEVSAKPTSWGSLLEDHVFPILGDKYRPLGMITMNHPTIDFWSGSPDALKQEMEGKTLVEIKCPYTLKSFCTLADCRTIQEVRENHKDGEKFYWQCVSNGIITGSKFAELVIFCPYKSELDQIRKMCEGDPKYYWLMGSQDDDLPFLPDGGFYRNLNIIRFEIPQEDKDLLTSRVLAAGKLLEKPFVMEFETKAA